MCNYQFCFQLAGRALCVRNEISKLLFGTARRPFRDVCRYGYRRSSDLRGQTELLLFWKRICCIVNRDNKSIDWPQASNFWCGRMICLLCEVVRNASPSTIYHFCSLQTQYGPIVMKCSLTQPHIRINDRRMANNREHRQVAHAVRVSVRLT